MGVLRTLLLYSTYGHLLFYIRAINEETVHPGGSRWPLGEFRAVWVPTVSNMDWPLFSNQTTAEQKAEFIALLDKLHQLNFNAIVFQIRSVGDALYNSSYEPWSVYLTGTQGQPPSPYYDPLTFVIDESHKRNIEVHAWFNPYRARHGSNSTTGLAPDHMAVKYPGYAYPFGSDLWMDPAARVVQDQCYNVIMDVIKNYDIDGVHLDDYFYPYPVSGLVFPDDKLYTSYRQNGGHLEKDDWRRDNVNTLIQRLYTSIKSAKKYVKFGLSPFGIWKVGVPSGVYASAPSYSAIYADGRKWFLEGWVDYFTPQLYWEIDPPQQSFSHLMDWWLKQNGKQRHFYAGSYAGKVVVNDWPTGEIKRQVEESRKRRNKLSLGNVFFSSKYFRDNSKGLSTMFKHDLYSTPALAPAMPWLCSSTPPVPSGVQASGSTLSWNKDRSGHIRSWALYKEEFTVWTLVRVLNKDTTRTSVSDGQYAITAVDRLSNQSDGVKIDVIGGNAIIG